MFAVAGQWRLDSSMSPQQEESLRHIVAGVAQSDGFIRGLWSRDVEDPEMNLTYIVFDTLEQARSFASTVRANAPAQSEHGVQRTSCASWRYRLTPSPATSRRNPWMRCSARTGTVVRQKSAQCRHLCCERVDVASCCRLRRLLDVLHAFD